MNKIFFFFFAWVFAFLKKKKKKPQQGSNQRLWRNRLLRAAGTMNTTTIPQ
jgi:hypothetical protein